MVLSTGIHKKLSIILIIGFLLSLLVGNTAFASGKDSVYDSYQSDSKQTDVQKSSDVKAEEAIQESPSFFSLMVKFIFSLLIIIALIWFFLKFLGKKTGNLQAKGPIKVIGGQNLGNNRSLQISMVGDTLYILGVGNDVQVIDKITDTLQQEKILASFDNYKESHTQFVQNTKLGTAINSYADKLKVKTPVIHKNNPTKFEKVLFEKMETEDTNGEKKGENK